MSAIQEPTTAQCAHCSGDYDYTTAIAGSFCSEECYYTHKGEKALNVARDDHRVCSTCLSWIKTVRAPSDKWKREKGSKTEQVLENGGTYHNVDGIGIALDGTDVEKAPTISGVDGFQTRTEYADTVEDERELDKYRRLIFQTTGCECGTPCTGDGDETIRSTVMARTLANAYRTLNKLEEQGAKIDRVNKDVLFKYYKETRNFEYALGRALKAR